MVAPKKPAARRASLYILTNTAVHVICRYQGLDAGSEREEETHL
jgi:hypothetical protein